MQEYAYDVRIIGGRSVVCSTDLRGTVGGLPGEGLTPPDVVKFVSAFAHWQLQRTGNRKIVIGRDGRLSGEMVRNLAVGTLQGMGIDVIDLDLSTTPTVEIAVPEEGAGGGIILTASHNPRQWKALKLLNEKGEFISAEDRSEEHTSELQSLMRISYAVLCLKKKKTKHVSYTIVL